VRAALVFAALVLVPTIVTAQTSPAPEPALPAAVHNDDEAIVTDDVLHAAPGRVPVHIAHARSNGIPIGLASSAPRRASNDARFTDERAPSFCRTPCTLHLTPGLHSLIGDVGGAHPWAIDVRVPAQGELSLRLRAHTLAWSAVGGVMFVVGVASSVIGPGAIVVSAVALDHRVNVPTAVIGSSVGVAGVAMFIGGWALIRYASPRLEWERADSARPPAPHVSAFAVPSLDGGASVSIAASF